MMIHDVLRKGTMMAAHNLPKLSIQGRLLPSFLLILPLVLFSLNRAEAQEAITWENLAEQLDQFFAPELLGDIQKGLPATPFDVWGFDVGDYSGDGYNDLIVSIRMKNDRSRDMKIFYFVDIEGIVEVVRQETAQFIELPIEVGVTIGDGKAYLIFKKLEGNWEIFGRQYQDGVIMLADHYMTTRGEVLTHETYRNFQALDGFDRYLRVRNDEEIFRNDFLTVPSYRRGRHISAGYAQTATASLSPYIVRGAYWRSDEKDLRINLRSAWDPDYLYFNVIVDDDQVEPRAYDNDSIGDRIEIWIDMYPYRDRFLVSSKRTDFRLQSDTNIYGLMVDLGDLADKAPNVRVSTTNLFDDAQTRATSKVRAFAARRDSGWTLRVRIPFKLFGFDTAPVDEANLLEIGATVVVHDLDNPWRPTEETVMASSQNFDSAKPATFGSVVIVPAALHYGESENIYFGEVKERLDEIGY
ncbi:MAG: sugar-binding protein [Candidatus Kapaibacterium sp.]